MTIFTIGHSTRSVDDVVAMLREHEVTALVDIRTIPRSRFNPQFNKDSLPANLEQSGINYVYMADLGGLRKQRKESANSGWRNASFRGYADYMGTEEFTRALNRLIDLAQKSKTAIMCAEAVPWRCHRSLVGDALSVRGIEVIDIMGLGKVKPHRLTPFLRVENDTLTYP
jgi:uncharacterized protein (DUF488 family)